MSFTEKAGIFITGFLLLAVIAKEIIALILSFGSDIEVVSPAPLRAEITKNIRALNNIYRIDEEK